MKNVFCVFMLFCMTTIIGQPGFSWAIKSGGGGSNSGTSIFVDATNNVYTTGYFSNGNLPFGLPPASGGYDAYVTKHTAGGVLSWARAFKGTSNEYGLSVCSDATGNVYVSGRFSGMVDFDPGAGTYTLNTTSVTNDDAFIVKLDALGSLVWAKAIGGLASAEVAYGIAVNSTGDVYTVGGFQSGSCDFDPGPGTFTMSPTNVGQDDIFISKLNSSGNFVWAKKIGGTGFDIGFSIDLDNSGNVYSTGFFNSSAPVDFDPGPGIFNLNFGGIFVSKLDANGNFLNAKQMLGGSSQGNSIKVDGAGNIFLGGYNPGIYFCKLDANMNLLWQRNPGSAAGANSCQGISLNGTALVVAGYFRSTVDLGAANSKTITSNGLEDVFLAKYDTSGNFICGGNFGGFGADRGNSVAFDNAGNPCVTGQFFGNSIITDFDMGPGTYTLMATTYDSYIAKYNTTCGSIALTPQVTPVNCFGASTGSINLLTLGGSPPFSYTWTPSVSTTSVATSLPAGNYTVYVSDASSPTSSLTISVAQNPNLNVNPGGSAVICSGTCTTLSGSASGGSTSYSYLWMPGSISSPTGIACPTVTTIYSLTVTDSKGCNKTATKTVTVNAAPTISVNSGSVCLSQNFQMIPSGANTYTFSSGSSIVSPTANTTYSVTGTSSLGCVSASPAISSVSVNPLPSISVNSGIICAGQSFTIIPSGANTYTFSGGSAVVSPGTNTSYSVSGTNSLGCVSNVPAVSTITVNPSPIITVNSGAICAGQSFTIIPSGASTYTFSGGSAVVSPTANTSYSVSGTNVLGCVNNIQAVSNVTVNSLPNITVSSSNSVLCVGQTATLIASGGLSYTWTPTGSGTNVAVTPTTNTSYTVTGSNANGCVNSSIITQTVSACTGIKETEMLDGISIYPNPNNGSFSIDLKNIENVSVEIYDSFGKLVYSETISENHLSVELSGLASGIYHLRIVDSAMAAYKYKLIIQ